MVKGRHPCKCQASKHDLVNNCLSCGRIVCEQEGPGPCLFCKTPVTDSGQPAKVYNEKNASLDSAIELRDRLLEYDKTSERRTRVIDDENDYFSSNSVWLSKDKRDAFKKKIEELQALKNSRGQHKLLLDFTGRVKVEDDALLKSINHENMLLQEIADIFGESSINDSNIDPKSTVEIQPVYESSPQFAEKSGSKWHNFMGRVQDRQLMEMTDAGMCLSMHQPWASLLIYGIKIHEGRSWYSSHRGRLWIASAAKVPTKEEITELEDQYKYMKGDNIQLPSHYPVGCLLGCVSVVDCLAQEEYREIYPDGESDSPFVFICENPIKCPVMFPLQGKHKIYKLDPKIHQAASKCIQRIASVKASLDEPELLR
ncbi:hypothetical protein AAG570_008654 [Ranatra chinensis]|uniref:ASCH domain-containing protein n=1 Tax=Ranatra chinensis TaxID=642074 RepID=A0ABD0YS69_9HEMI